MKYQSRAKWVLIIMVCICASVFAHTNKNKASSHWGTDTYKNSESSNAARILDKPNEQINLIMQIGSFSSVVHEKPSVHSRAVTLLHMGDAVRVVELLDWYRVPGTSLMDEKAEKEEYIAIWAKIETPKVKGYVSTRSLVSPERLAKVDAETAEENAAGQGDEAGGGFSKSVKKKKKNFAKGVGGTPPQEGADYVLITAIVETSPLVYVPYNVPADSIIENCGMTLEELDPEFAKEIAELEKKNSSKNSKKKDESNAKPKEEKKEEKKKNPFGGGNPFGSGNPFGGIGESSIGYVQGPFDKIGGGGGNPLDALGDVFPPEVAELFGQLMQERLATPLEEYYLGRECAALSTGGAPRLPAVHPVSVYVSKIGHELAANSTMPYPIAGYQFVVLNDDKTKNAIAAPGGFIFITTGMLRIIENEDQLAVILGHEIAHCEERHGIMAANDSGFMQFPAFLGLFDMLGQGMLEGILEDALSNVDLPQGMGLDFIKDDLIQQATDGFNEVISGAIASIQSPDEAAETAADERGMSLACAAGYDPKAIVGMLEVIKTSTGTYGGAGYSDTRNTDAEVLLTLLPRTKHDSPEGISELEKRTARFNSTIETLDTKEPESDG